MHLSVSASQGVLTGASGSFTHCPVAGWHRCPPSHGGTGPGLLRAAQPQLCMDCHDVSKSHIHPYQGPAKDPRTGRPLACTSCHNPHASAEVKLLTHDKKRALCVQCHLGPDLEVRGRAGEAGPAPTTVPQPEGKSKPKSSSAPKPKGK